MSKTLAVYRKTDAGNFLVGTFRLRKGNSIRLATAEFLKHHPNTKPAEHYFMQRNFLFGKWCDWGDPIPFETAEDVLPTKQCPSCGNGHTWFAEPDGITRLWCDDCVDFTWTYTGDWTMLCKRTNDPELAWIERELDKLGIPHRRNGESWHAPILEVAKDRESDANELLMRQKWDV